MTQHILEQKIGQLFLLGFAGDRIDKDHPIARDIQQGNLGGVILFDRCLALSRKSNNIVSGDQVCRLTASLQKLAVDAPLLIAVDQEGGRVSRFAKERGFPVTLPAGELGRSDDLQATKESGRQTARMLKKVGINLNLAPVVDLDIYQENPIIGRYARSFSADPAVVTGHAEAWIREHEKAGVLSCLKHFPGHGSSRTDSHLGFVDISESWQQAELLPYRQLISRGRAEAIMVGHLFHKELDPQYPATLSKSIIRNVVRRQLGFNGVVISDDMQMKAITGHYGLEEACCRALDAGVDLLIIGNNLVHDPDILIKVKEQIVQGLDEGTISEARVEEAWGRVQKFKKLLLTAKE